MTTATEMVSWALQLLRVVDPGEDLAEYQYIGAQRALNGMMRRWEANGLSLGWQPVSNPANVLPIPEEAEEAVAYNLAMRCRPLYGATLEPDVIAYAKQALADLLRDQLVATPVTLITNAPYGYSYWGVQTNGITGGFLY